ncbi:MAG TPA: DUF2934 domain-containing protein [Pirellulales bacterium]|nr:DUF2934 domain-containing protein [Pirellulales bacterium]
MKAIRNGEREAAVARQETVLPGHGQPTEYRLPDRELIARRAYEIWLRHGRPAGTAFHDWLAAEAELRSVPRRPR